MADEKQTADGGEHQWSEAELESARRYREQKNGGVSEDDANANQDDKQGDKGGEKQKPERPAHIPVKFWNAETGEVNVEAMAKSYAELEKRGAQKPAKGTEGTNDGTKDGEGEKPNDGENTGDAHAAAVKAFTDLRAKATEALTAGEEISEEMYAGFEKHGLAREDIDAWVAGQAAIGTLAKMEVHAAVGGEDHYKAMIEWARANFEEAEVAVYDRDIHSYDKAVRLAAARGLQARYEQANGKGGKNVTNGGGGKRGPQGYESGAQMREAMRDPRYAKDPAYREEVARKVAAARAAGVDLMV